MSSQKFFLLLLLICFSTRNLLGVKVNPAALKAGAPVDFLDPHEVDLLNQLKNSSLSTFELAKELLRQLQTNDCRINCSISLHSREMTALSPIYGNSCPLWLKVAHVERAGLGHTFSSWSFYLSLAIDNGLTYYSPFYTSAHNTAKYLVSSAKLFGFHSVFFWARQPRNDALYIAIGRELMNCHSEMLSKYVNQYRNRTQKTVPCTRDVVFVCYNANVDFQRRYLRSIVPISRPLRAVFMSGFEKFSKRLTAVLSTSPLESNQISPSSLMTGTDEFRIVVHIRRGDLLRTHRIDHNREISVDVYISLLKQVLSCIETQALFASSNSSQRLISVTVLCEESPNTSNVVEFSYKNSHRAHSVNISSALHSACNFARNFCSVRILSTDDVNEAFMMMAQAAVLVTSPSAFPWMAASLVDPPLTIAFPLVGATSYIGLENVIFPVSKDGKRLWEPNTEVELPGIEEALKHAMRRLSKYGHGHSTILAKV